MHRSPLALALLVSLPLAGCASRAAAQPAIAAGAPAVASAPAEPRAIRVRGEATVSVKPDVAIVEAGVQVTAKDAQKASADANARMRTLLAELAKLGVEARDVQTSQFTLTAERPWENGRQLPVQGYTSTSTVRIKVRNLEQLPQLLGRLPAAGVNDVRSVQFAREELGPFRDEALALAVRAAQARAQVVAKAAGVSLGPVVTIDVELSQPVRPFAANLAMRAEKGAGDAPVAEGELEVFGAVNVSYSIR